MRQDNRGLTLVELIIAMSISVLIFAAATFFLRTAYKGYEKATDTIDLQMETQVLMEQLGTWIMESNRVETGSEMLIIYSIPRTVSADKLPDGTDPVDDRYDKRIIWQTGGKLYMVLQTKKDRSGLASDSIATTTIDPGWVVPDNCVGEYVTEFSPSIDSTRLRISLKMSAGSSEYELSNQFQIRNELALNERKERIHEELA